MSSRIDTTGIVAGAFEAALDDGLWAGWAERLMAQLGAVSATFWVIGDPETPIERMLPLGRSLDMAEEYFAFWWQHDPGVAHVATVDRPCSFVSAELVADRGDATRAYRDWMRRRGGCEHDLSVVTPLGESGRRGGLSMHRDMGDGPVPTGIRQQVEAMMPGIVRALQLGFRHQQLLADRYWDGVSTGGEAEAALLLDERGAVMRATARALEIVEAGDGLRIGERRLRACLPAEDDRLAALVARAIAPDAAASDALRISRPSGRRGLVVVAYPLARRRRTLAPLEAAAILRLVDPARPKGAPDLFRAAFGLTAREAGLAKLLGEGHSAESAAAVLGIALPTARVHVRNLLAKTQTSRQAELVQLYARVAR